MYVSELCSWEEYVQNEEGRDWVAQEATFFFLNLCVTLFFLNNLRYN